jgi:hypothetical protein
MPWDVVRGGRRTIKKKVGDVVLGEQTLHPYWLQYEVVPVGVLWQ